MSVASAVAEVVGIPLSELDPAQPVELDSLDALYLIHLCEQASGREVPEEKLRKCRTACDWVLAYQC